MLKQKHFLILLCLLTFTLLFGGCTSKDNDKPIYTELSDLEGSTVGVITGTTFDKMAETVWEDYELKYLNDFADLIPAMESHNIDCFISDKPWIQYVSDANPAVTFIDETLAEEDYGLVFAKNQQGADIRDDFNAYLAEIEDLQSYFDSVEKVWFSADEANHHEIDYAALPATNGTIRVCTNVANPPFEYYENQKIVGYNIQIIYDYCKARGYGMTIDDMKFDALIPAVVSGKYDIASSSFTITAERAESVNFSDTIYVSGPVVAIRTENAGTAGATESLSFTDKIITGIQKNFIREQRWKLFIGGIGLTVFITLMSLILGTLLGFLLYLWQKKGRKLSRLVTGFLSWLISGMPEVLLLLILFYIVFANTPLTGTWVAIIAFTLIVSVNVLTMMQSGVGAVDKGQREAALALGYSERRSFYRIVLPQALQHIMPGYKGSVITLIKSTAIVGYLAVQDLTKVSDIIRSQTYEAFFPLIATAIIYFILAWLLVQLVSVLQKKLLPIRNGKDTILKGIQVTEEGKSND